MERLLVCAALAACALLSSCSSYMTPGAAADLSTFTNPQIKQAFTAKPAIHFPANLAIAHVQGSGYRSRSCTAWGVGAYSVVTVRETENEKDLDRISKLNGVAGVAMLNRLLVPRDLKSDLDLRQAAARLQADAIIVYTVSTEFSHHDVIPPLTTFSLGLFPNTRFKVNSTVSALLMDTKTGFIYGTLEETASDKGITIPLLDENTFESTRIETERKAFEKALSSFESLWARVYTRHRG